VRLKEFQVSNVGPLKLVSVSELANVVVLAGPNDEASRVAAGLNPSSVNSLVVSEYERLNKAIEEDDDIWLLDLPGRVILNKFSAAANISVGRLKQAYLANANKATVFADIINIFEQFRDRQRGAGSASPSPGHS
jgi:hypothetical protein